MWMMPSLALRRAALSLAGSMIGVEPTVLQAQDARGELSNDQIVVEARRSGEVARLIDNIAPLRGERQIA